MGIGNREGKGYGDFFLFSFVDFSLFFGVDFVLSFYVSIKKKKLFVDLFPSSCSSVPTEEQSLTQAEWKRIPDRNFLYLLVTTVEQHELRKTLAKGDSCKQFATERYVCHH